ncbi:hypothetical protein Lalb_Chr10g0104621 [Lupinus albus]|uniref:Uncharacterized protein n=1 Tax=Lupinus albus TaxID=3870 RepID=A0A6A4PXS3_LUPAL|nr:hypothetical protein Lalb_Chr10g0104621 [Lupinus albus]
MVCTMDGEIFVSYHKSLNAFTSWILWVALFISFLIFSFFTRYLDFDLHVFQS